VRVTQIEGTRSAGATDNDFGSWRDHGAGGGGLLARNTVAGDLNLESGATGLLNDFANGQADEGWHAQFSGIGDYDCVR
jgi:hypothetical protein